MTDRFTLTPVFNVKDNLTGREYDVGLKEYREVCELLNDLNSRADRNAELFFIANKIVMEVQRILDKYEIDGLKKLDQILMEQRVW